MLAMTTVWLALRADVRRRWPALLSLALLLGLIGGVVLTAAAGARRTDSAYPRLLQWANATQLEIAPEGTGFNGYYTALARLPHIAAMATAQLYTAVLSPRDQTDSTSARVPTGPPVSASTGSRSSPAGCTTRRHPGRPWSTSG